MSKTETSVNRDQSIHASILMIMGTLWMSGLVDQVNMGGLMRILGASAELDQQYNHVYVQFDEDFFNEYNLLTGIDLRTVNPWYTSGRVNTESSAVEDFFNLQTGQVKRVIH